MPTGPKTLPLEKPKPQQSKPKIFKGVCVYCGSRAIQMAGKPRGKQCYRCKTCGRYMGGFPVPARSLSGHKSTEQGLHCPKCRGAARIHERVDERRSRLRCDVCGYCFTDCYWIAPPDREGGPFPYQKTFYLDISAFRALMELSRETGLGYARAIRLVLREEAWASPVYAIATRGRVLRRPRPTLEMPAPHVLAARLPDVSRARIGERAAKTEAGVKGFIRTVGVVAAIGVSMDAVAKAGLLKGMAKYGCDHQQAIRHLLTDRPRAR